MGTNALRKCRDCGIEAKTEEELDGFVLDLLGKHGKQNLCKPCCVKRSLKRDLLDGRSGARDRSRLYSCRVSYKCTLEEYKERMSTTNQCEVCGTFDNLCYDHCHSTKDFRGVLCSSCNISIGQLGDTLEDIQKVVDYLNKPAYTSGITSKENVNEED